MIIIYHDYFTLFLNIVFQTVMLAGKWLNANLVFSHPLSSQLLINQEAVK